MSGATGSESDYKKETETEAYNTEQEEDAIRKNCYYVRKILEDINEGGFNRMNKAAKEELLAIRKVVSKMDIGDEDAKKEVDFEIGKGDEKVSNDEKMKEDMEKEYEKLGAKPKVGGRYRKRNYAKPSDQLVKNPMVKTESETSCRESSSSSEESKTEGSQPFKNERPSRSRKKRMGESRLLREIVSKLDNRKAPRPDMYNDRDGEPLEKFLKKFEKYCEHNFKGDSDGWIGELGTFLEGDTLKAFKQIKQTYESYGSIKREMLEWYEDGKDLRKKRARRDFNTIKYEKGESLYLYSTRVERKFRLAHPKSKVESSSTLREKFIKTVLKSVGTAMSSHIMSNRIIGRSVTWAEIQKIARYTDVDLANNLEEKESSGEEIVINVEDKQKRQYQPNNNSQTRKGDAEEKEGKPYSSNNYQRKNTWEPTRSYNRNRYGNNQARGNDRYNQRGNNQRFVAREPPNTARCDYCYRMGHEYETCRYRLRLCLICAQKGHMMRDCPFNRQRTQSQPPPREQAYGPRGWNNDQSGSRNGGDNQSRQGRRSSN